MAEITGINWCDSTFNPWRICTPVGPGCDNCYAAAFGHRFGLEYRQGVPRLRTSAANWRKPVQWNAGRFYECNGCGWRGSKPHYWEPGALGQCPTCRSFGLTAARRRVFCASLADVFDNEPAEWRADLFDLIRRCDNLDFLLLTKRIGNAQRMLDEYIASDGHTGETWVRGWPNLWLGATVVNQAEVDRDIPKLLDIPAAVRFLSIEPLLGEIRIDDHLKGSPRISWVVCGGESGPGARPCHVGWIRGLVEQCRAAAVPCFVKQLGARALRYTYADSQGKPAREAVMKLDDRKGGDMREFPEELRVREFPRSAQ